MLVARCGHLPVEHVALCICLIKVQSLSRRDQSRVTTREIVEVGLHKLAAMLPGLLVGPVLGGGLALRLDVVQSAVDGSPQQLEVRRRAFTECRSGAHDDRIGGGRIGQGQRRRTGGGLVGCTDRGECREHVIELIGAEF